jgi:aryl-alcohol dehydrogenase-like predicted oxidoreductase
MEYVRLGNTGLEVSRLCLGCMSFGVPDENRPWVLQDDEARPLFRQAWEKGITFFDTANIYAKGTSEELTGRLLKELAPRDQYVLATKVYNRMSPGPNGAGLSRKAIFAEIDNSLTRLKTDYVDLYQIHRWDYFTPIEETLEALHDVVKAGKARYIGASSMYSWQFAKALFTADLHGWTRFVSMQNEVNLVAREEEREMLPLCVDQGIGVIPWSPLGGGKLTRPWGEATRRSQTNRFGMSMYEQTEGGAPDVVAAVQQLAERRNVPMARIALAWLLHKSEITSPIVGGTKASHVDDAVAAMDVKLTAEEIAQLEAPYQPRRAAIYLSKEEAVNRGRIWHWQPTAAR